MVIKRKAVKEETFDIDKKIVDIIERGGTTYADKKESQDGTFRFTLRGPDSYLKRIDEARKKKVGNVSRNQWILEAIEEMLNR